MTDDTSARDRGPEDHSATKQKQPAVLVAMLATVAVCMQNSGVGLGLGWGLIHGVGPALLLMLVPLALGVAILWAGYAFLRRRSIKNMPVLFTLYALGILLLNEVLLPTTPLRAWRIQRSLAAVNVHNIRDDVYLTPRGNPIGIRVTFDVRFPADAVCNVHASTLGLLEHRSIPPTALQFTFRHRTVIEPAPSSEGLYHVFRKDTIYRITEITLPNFLSYDERTQELCLKEVTTPSLSEADLLSALSRSRNEHYRTDIFVSSDYSPVSTVAYTYMTSRKYHVEAMYQSLVREGNRRCEP